MLHAHRSRSVGITVLAVIVTILGIAGIIIGIFLIGTGFGIATLILGILELIVAWGLWSLQSWAYWAMVILQILILLDGIFALSIGGFFTGVVIIIIAVAILVYTLSDSRVRATFRS